MSKIFSLFLLAGTMLVTMTLAHAQSPQDEVEGALGSGAECFSNGDCGADSYCAFPVGSCGEDEQAGMCRQRPEVCIDIYDPVCGCDDRTYSNACFAALAGVSVRHEGECTP